MERVDFIIVGQGLAGTTLARRLVARGLRVLVVDREGDSSSRIAAGLITPVTGKRLARSWRWDELYPAAVAYYRDFQRETGDAVLHQRPALRLFATEEERDEFDRRAAGVLAGLVRKVDDVPAAFAAPLGGFEMPTAARLDVPRYLDASREHFRRTDAYRVADLDPTREIELVSDGVRLTRLGVEARGLVFCRGFTPGVDPWFGRVKFNAAKGEILTLRIPGLAEDRVVHRGVWLAPVGGDVFRCGSTYTWEPLDCEPTAEGRAEIESRLREFLRIPYEVIDHRAAIRPVIDAGFAVLLRHREHPRIAYFNGLGSKGSLLAPFFADELAACLIENRKPNP
jgi:glycine oxidase